ncbi:MAG: helix-hairpin-helix domain-containing protein [Nitrososphaerota archaeon]
MEPVSNQQIADVLFNIATLLEMQQGNPYRIEAYRNAARGMLALPIQVTDIIAQGARLEAPGLGDRLRRKITELATTGHMTFYDDLCEESLPADVRDLMRVPHVGPRTALRLANQLDIHSVEELANAAEHQRLRPYYGFGERSEHRLAEGARGVLNGPHDHDGGQAAA